MDAERSVHDNRVYAYSVDCAGRRIVLHTAYEGRSLTEHTDVIFRGVLAHHFEHVLDGNILFDVEIDDLERFVRKHAGLFATSWRWAWPPVRYDGDLERLVLQLRSNGVIPFVISSSYGMSGWVLAESCERVARDASYSIDG